MITCSVGVMAYNEAANIARLLQALAQQELRTVAIESIVVVASGCTDETPTIVERVAAREPRVHLVIQTRRLGKAAAINAFLAGAATDVLVLESADTLPEPDAIQSLVEPFDDPTVGMTGARPIPTNNQHTFWGHAAHLLWGLHHDIALQHPKLGELVAFRNVLPSIPEDTAVDEASIEAQVAANGLTVRYVPKAVVYNAGPETVGDFLRQRRRIYAGHLHLRETSHHEVSTMRVAGILGSLARRLPPDPRRLAFTAAVVSLEAWARALALYDYRVRKRNPFVWDIAGSTKSLTLPGAGVGDRRGHGTG